MPLIRGDSLISTKRPEPPNMGPGDKACPAQGDHVFGDIVNVLKTGLMEIVGGGQEWIGSGGRFNKDVYDNGATHPLKTFTWHKALRHWQNITLLDLGHSPGPAIGRVGSYLEPDNHSRMFGGYARILQWDLCEIGAKGRSGFNCIGSESRQAGEHWVRTVLSSYDKTMRYLIDSTALEAYLKNGETNRPQPSKEAPHTAISKEKATKDAGHSTQNSHCNRIRTICNNFDLARWELRQMLEAMSHINILWHESVGQQSGKWISF